MKNIFKLSILLFCSFFPAMNLNAQFSCSTGITINDGYTSGTITTPGNGGVEDWVNSATTCGISSSYLTSDDVYLFSFTTCSVSNFSMTVNSNRTWTGMMLFGSCSGSSLSSCIDDDSNGSSTGTLTVSDAALPAGTWFVAIGQWGAPNDLNFEVTNVQITGGACGPIINVSPSSLNGFSYCFGSGPSTSQSFQVDGSMLTNDILITAPMDFEISTDNFTFGNSITLAQSSGSVSSTTIYVRLKSGLNVANYGPQNIIISSTGATSQIVTIEGDVTSNPISINAISGTSPIVIGNPIDLNATVSGCTGNQILFFEDFESGLGQFTSTGNTLFTINSTYQYSGSKSAHNAYGSSNNNYLRQNSNMDLSGVTSATLKFWHIAKTEGNYDDCVVQVSEDGGTTWTNAIGGPYDEDDDPAWGTAYETPDNTWWREITIDLTPYVGQNDIRIGFWLDSDGSANRYGWLIDDVTVEASGTICDNYSWTGPNAFNANTENAQVTGSAVGNENGWYYLTASANGCSITDSTEILPSGPIIIANPLFLSNLDYYDCAGGPSTSQSFIVSGSTLTNDILITSPTDYEISTDNVSFSNSITLTESGGSVSNTTIYTRLKDGLSIDSYNDSIVMTSVGANPVSIVLSGDVLNDTQDPIANCTNISIALDSNNQAILTPEIANSSYDFSSNQGSNNWEYGKYPAFNHTAFTQIPSWNSTKWEDVQTNNTPYIDTLSTHPGIDDLIWVVRRWTSNQTGNIIVSGEFYDLDTNCGDGANIRIFKNNIQVYEYLNIPNTTTAYSFVIAVVNGDKIDFVVDPKLDASCDETIFTHQIQTNLIDLNSSDNCGIQSLSNSLDTLNCSHIGTNSITLTVTDNSGRTSSCNATVTIEDTIPPTIICPFDITTTVDLGSCVATGVNLGTPTTSDNCGGEVASNDAPANFPIGNTVVTWTVTDLDGNTASCTQNVTVSGPSISLNEPLDVCVNGADMNFSGTPTNANGVFTSTASTGFTDNGDGTAILDVDVAGAGTYDVIYTYCSGESDTSSVTILPLDDATFHYDFTSYCQTIDSDPTPTITGLTGGTFSSTPAGLTINPSTGEITLATSSDGNYTISYLTNGNCPVSYSQSLLIGCNGAETANDAPDITNSCNPGDLSNAQREMDNDNYGPNAYSGNVAGFGTNFFRYCDNPSDNFDNQVDYRDVWYKVLNPAGADDLNLTITGLAANEYIAFALYSAIPDTNSSSANDDNIIPFDWTIQLPNVGINASFFSSTETTRELSGFANEPVIYIRLMSANPNASATCNDIIRPSNFTICATLPEPNDECANAINITLNNPTSPLSWFSNGDLNAASNPNWSCSWHPNSLGAGTETLKDLWYYIDLITSDGDPSIYSGPYYINLLAEGATGDQIIVQLMNGCFTSCSAYDAEEGDVLATDTLIFASPDSSLFYNNYQGFGAVASGLPYELRTLDLYDPLYLRVMPIGTMNSDITVGAQIRAFNDELWRYYDQCIETDFTVENTSQLANFNFASPSAELLADGASNTLRDLWYHFEPNSWNAGTIPATSFLPSVSSTYADITVSGLQTGEEIEFMLYKETTCFNNVVENQSTYDHTDNYLTNLTVNSNGIHRISCLDENYNGDYILRILQTGGTSIAKPTISVAPSNVMPPENNTCENIWSAISEAPAIGPNGNPNSDVAHNWNQFYILNGETVTGTFTGSNDCGLNSTCNAIDNDPILESDDRAVWYVFQVPNDQCNLFNNIEANTTSTPGPGSSVITSMTFIYTALGVNPNFKDGNLYVYDVCGGNLLACSGTLDGAGSSWTATGLEQGKFYLLKVEPNKLNTNKDYDFNIELVQGDVGPCNDEPDNAWPIDIGQCNDYATLDTFSAQGATETSPITGAPESDVWFSFIAPNGANGGPYSYQSSWVTVFFESVSAHKIYIELYENESSGLGYSQTYETTGAAGSREWGHFGNLISGKQYFVRLYHKESISNDVQYKINIHTGPGNDPGWKCGETTISDLSGCNSGCSTLSETWYKIDLPDGAPGNSYWYIAVEGQDQHLDFELRSKYLNGASTYNACSNGVDGLEGSCADYDHPCSSSALEPAVSAYSTTTLAGCDSDSDGTNDSGVKRVYFNMNGATPGAKDYYYLRVFISDPAQAANATGLNICNVTFKGPYSTGPLAEAGGAPDEDCETLGCDISNIAVVTDSLCNGVNATFTVSFDVENGSGFYDVIATADNPTLGIFAGDVLTTIAGSSDQIGLSITADVFGPTTGPTSLFVKVADNSRQGCESTPIEVIIPDCPNCNADAGMVNNNSSTPDSLVVCFGSDLLSGATNTEVIFNADYSNSSEINPGFDQTLDLDFAYLLADSLTGNIVQSVTNGNFDFSSIAVGTYFIWQLSYPSSINNSIGNESNVVDYLATVSNISDIIDHDNDTSSGGLGIGSYCLDIDSSPIVGTSNAITVLSSPTISDILIECGSSSGGASITIISSSNTEYSIDGLNYQSSNVFEGVKDGEKILYVRSTIGNYCVTTETISIECNSCNCPDCPEPPTSADGKIIQISACPVTDGTYSTIAEQDVAAETCYNDPNCPDNIPFGSWKEAVAYTNDINNNVVGIFYQENYYSNTIPSPSPYGATSGGYALTKDNVYIDFAGAILGEDGGEGAVAFTSILADNIVLANGNVKDYDGTGILVKDAQNVLLCNMLIDNSDGANFDGLQVESDTRNTDLTVINSTFQNNNHATGRAVGIYNASTNSNVSTSVTFCNSSISCNYSQYSGAGMGVLNKPSRGSSLSGPFVCFIGGSFFDNESDANGGGLYAIDNATINIDGVEFVQNKTLVAAGDGGGAVYSGGNSTVEIQNSNFKENTAFSSNTNGGGAILHNDGTLFVNNSIFELNGATQGGAVYLRGGSNSTSISESYFIANKNTALSGANNKGGGIYVDATTSSITMQNNTFSSQDGSTTNDNLSACGPDIYLGSGLSISNNDVEFPIAGTGLVGWQGDDFNRSASNDVNSIWLETEPNNSGEIVIHSSGYLDFDADAIAISQIHAHTGEYLPLYERKLNAFNGYKWAMSFGQASYSSIEYAVVLAANHPDFSIAKGYAVVFDDTDNKIKLVSFDFGVDDAANWTSIIEGPTMPGSSGSANLKVSYNALTNEWYMYIETLSGNENFYDAWSYVEVDGTPCDGLISATIYGPVNNSSYTSLNLPFTGVLYDAASTSDKSLYFDYFYWKEIKEGNGWNGDYVTATATSTCTSPSFTPLTTTDCESCLDYVYAYAPNQSITNPDGITICIPVCTDGDWTHYGVESEKTIYFSIKHNGNDLEGTEVDVYVQLANEIYNYQAENLGAGINGTPNPKFSVMMRRGWDVRLGVGKSVDPAKPTSVRFYYPQYERTMVENKIANNAIIDPAMVITPFYWYKNQGDNYRHNTIGAQMGAADHPAFVDSMLVLTADFEANAGPTKNDYFTDSVNYVQFSGITSFSGGSGGGGGLVPPPSTPLPVELLNFNGYAKETTNYIYWATATEVNADKFEVEKSIDGQNFKKIGEVKAAGNSSEVTNYDFEDNKLAQISYYRLKQIDFDGSFEYSKIIAINRTIKTDLNISIYPNPTAGLFYIEVNNLQNEYSYQLQNSIGVVVVKGMLNEPITTVQTQQLANGVYYLTVNDGNEILEKRKVILHK